MTIDVADRAALQGAVQDLLCSRCTERDVRQVLTGDDGFNRDLWRRLAGQGVTGIKIAAEYGGVGLGAAELEAVAEETGAALLPSPFIPSAVLTAALIQAAGTKEDHLPRSSDPWVASRERVDWLENVLDTGYAVPTYPAEWFGRAYPNHLASVIETEFKAVRAPGLPALQRTRCRLRPRRRAQTAVRDRDRWVVNGQTAIIGTEALLAGPDNPEPDDINFLTLNAYFTSIGGGTESNATSRSVTRAGTDR